MIRYPAVSGSFYPDDPDELDKLVESYIANTKKLQVKGNLRGIIVPHAGYIYSGQVAAYAYKQLIDLEIEKVILIGPSHYGIFNGFAESGSNEWKMPFGSIKTFSLNQNVISKAHESEHSLEVQLPFLHSTLKEFKFCPLLTGNIDPILGANILEKSNDFFVISSDLSHYLPYNSAKIIDGSTLKAITNLDIDSFLVSGEACGKTGIGIMMEICKRKNWEIELLNYSNSGESAGPKNQVVGYAALAVIE